MPTYCYRCKKCKKEFEVFQSMNEPALTTCDSCDGDVMRIIQPVGIQFKGTGFYINDKSSDTSTSPTKTSDSE